VVRNTLPASDILDAKELITTIQPWQGVFQAVIRWKQQLVAMLDGKHDCVVVALFFLLAIDIDDLLRL
jgi:hypothetical protein